MGEISEMILEGLLCQVCGSYMDDFEEPGYPRTCEDCKEREKEMEISFSMEEQANDLAEQNQKYKESFRIIETYLRIDGYIEMHILAEIIEGLEGE